MMYIVYTSNCLHLGAFRNHGLTPRCIDCAARLEVQAARPRDVSPGRMAPTVGMVLALFRALSAMPSTRVGGLLRV